MAAVQIVGPALVDSERVLTEERGQLGDGYDQAAELFQRVALSDDFVEFLTLPAYDLLP